MEGEGLWVSKQREQGMRSRDFWGMSENRLRTNEKLSIKAATSCGAILKEAKQGSQRAVSKHTQNKQYLTYKEAQLQPHSTGHMVGQQGCHAR